MELPRELDTAFGFGGSRRRSSSSSSSSNHRHRSRMKISNTRLASRTKYQKTMLLMKDRSTTAEEDSVFAGGEHDASMVQ